MNRDALKQQFELLQKGELSPTRFAEMLLAMPSSPAQPPQTSADVCLDRDRARRCGFAEVVFGQGKSNAAVLQAVRGLLELHEEALVTRSNEDHVRTLREAFPFVRWDQDSKCVRVRKDRQPNDPATVGAIDANNSGNDPYVAVVSAGTTDGGVAKEASETLAWMQIPSVLIQDVGVAGPYRLFGHLETLRGASAVVVVAGMEAALASVVGGHVKVPIIAVPTSVGYGAHFQGLAALLSMINSCAANVTTVNIDAGFKGGYIAGLIVSQMQVVRKIADANESQRSLSP